MALKNKFSGSILCLKKILVIVDDAVDDFGAVVAVFDGDM